MYSETTNVHHSFANSFILPNSEPALAALLAALTRTSKSLDAASKSADKALKIVSLSLGAYLVLRGVAHVIEAARATPKSPK